MEAEYDQHPESFSPLKRGHSPATGASGNTSRHFFVIYLDSDRSLYLSLRDG
jgi:hypothetical protein